MYNFRKYREEKGVTQQFVALSLGVKAPSVNEWESGKSNPNLKNLIALARLLDVSIDRLLGVDTNAPCADDSEIEWNFDEKKLVEDYRKLSEQGQQFIKQAMSGALAIYKKRSDFSNMESEKIG